MVTFTFSEAVDQGLVAIALENGTLSELTWNAAGTAATAIFTADDGVDGTGRVTVTSFTDLAGNAGTAAADGTRSIRLTLTGSTRRRRSTLLTRLDRRRQRVCGDVHVLGGG